MKFIRRQVESIKLQHTEQICSVSTSPFLTGKETTKYPPGCHTYPISKHTWTRASRRVVELGGGCRFAEAPCKEMNPCGANTRCEVVSGVARCTCLPGFKGRPLDGCRHECDSDFDCPQHQACSASFRCEDPCATKCGENAECNVVNHRAICTCPKVSDPRAHMPPPRHVYTRYVEKHRLAHFYRKSIQTKTAKFTVDLRVSFSTDVLVRFSRFFDYYDACRNGGEIHWTLSCHTGSQLDPSRYQIQFNSFWVSLTYYTIKRSC